MRMSYQQSSCPNNKVGNALETIASAEMIFGLALVIGKVVMVYADSCRQQQKVKLAEGRISQTNFYLKKREEKQSRLPSQTDYYP